MKLLKNIPLFVPFFLLILFQTSCKKYLDKKPDQGLAVPSNLKDLRALLDDPVMNGNSPSYAELVADNYYVTSDTWNSLTNQDIQLNYIWDENASFATNEHLVVWFYPYQTIYQANFVLDLLPKINFDETERDTYNNIKGAALFHRAFMFHQLAQLFCQPYSNSASTEPGIVLKLSSIVTERYSRSTVQQTYDQIITDLKEAISLLPKETIYATRPNKPAAYGALARVYLSMREYDSAAKYAEAALSHRNELLDYNSLSPNNTLPINYLSNPEVLFLCINNPSLFTPPKPIVDSNLYLSYHSDDLRKTVFFGDYGGGKHFWKGSYHSTAGYYYVFSGIATDEIYLIRAECKARTGNKDSAMNDLNMLLSHRWRSGSFVDLTASDAADALDKILTERRKELLFRGIRWSDLRRFKLENVGIDLKRIINGTTYTLPASEDMRWVLSIPDIEISRSGISQNPR